MDEVIRGLANPQFFVTAILARWHAPTGTLTFLNCGHPPGYVADPDGALRELEGPRARAAGQRRRRAHVRADVDAARDRGSGSSSSPTAWSTARSRAAAPSASTGCGGRSSAAPAPTAAATAMAIQHAVTDCWEEPLSDDATLVVLAVD